MLQELRTAEEGEKTIWAGSGANFLVARAQAHQAHSQLTHCAPQAGVPYLHFHLVPNEQCEDVYPLPVLSLRLGGRGRHSCELPVRLQADYPSMPA